MVTSVSFWLVCDEEQSASAVDRSKLSTSWKHRDVRVRAFSQVGGKWK